MRLLFITLSAAEILKANKQNLDHFTVKKKKLQEQNSVPVYKTTMAK